jgi:hypothetical protein
LAKDPKKVGDADPVLAREDGTPCKKGDRVRLIVPHHDGMQLHREGAEVIWWANEPPLAANAVFADQKETPLNAPIFSPSAPPADYVDPATGEPPKPPAA